MLLVVLRAFRMLNIMSGCTPKSEAVVVSLCKSVLA